MEHMEHMGTVGLLGWLACVSHLLLRSRRADADTPSGVGGCQDPPPQPVSASEPDWDREEKGLNWIQRVEVWRLTGIFFILLLKYIAAVRSQNSMFLATSFSGPGPTPRYSGTGG